jgi:hypothetical protein
MYLSLLAETWLRNSEACAIRFCCSRIAPAPRCVIARKPLWVSVTERPLVMRVNQVAALSTSRRVGGRLMAPPRTRLPSEAFFYGPFLIWHKFLSSHAIRLSAGGGAYAG